jgi:hypothetical protein
MLVYKHQNIFSLFRTKQRCADCQDINKCYWHKPKKNPGLEACFAAKFEFKNPEIIPANANWMLFQIGRDLELTKNVIEQKLNTMSYNLPQPMRVNHWNVDESRIYIKVLKSFLDYIVVFEKEVKRDREKLVSEIVAQRKLVDAEKEARKKLSLSTKLKTTERRLISLDSEIGRFVGSIIETTIKVSDKEISIFSESEDLIDKFKKVAVDSNYLFMRQSINEEARKWLGQITNAN